MLALSAVAAAAILATPNIHATVSPVAATPDGQVRVTVTGVNAPKVSVQLAGGIASGGKWFGWVALRSNGPGSWWTVLRAPGFLGVYPIRVRANGLVTWTTTSVQILPRGFFAQPGFDTPAQVAEWWTRVSPAGASLTTITTWHEGFFTHRDPALNDLMRVQFTLRRAWPAMHMEAGPNEIFLSVARLRVHGLWRLLETPTAP